MEKHRHALRSSQVSPPLQVHAVGPHCLSHQRVHRQVLVAGAPPASPVTSGPKTRGCGEARYVVSELQEGVFIGEPDDFRVHDERFDPAIQDKVLP